MIEQNKQKNRFVLNSFTKTQKYEFVNTAFFPSFLLLILIKANDKIDLNTN